MATNGNSTRGRGRPPKDKTIVLKALSETADTNLLLQTATSADKELVAAVAQNPNCPPALLTQLATSNARAIQNAVASNPASPPDILAEMSDSDFIYLREAAAGNPNTPVNALAWLFLNDSLWDTTINRILRHQQAALIMETALQRDFVYECRNIYGFKKSDKAVPKPIIVPHTTVFSFIMSDPKILVQRIKQLRRECMELLQDPSMPPVVLSEATHSLFPSQRRAVAGNPSTPLKRMVDLIFDKRLSVRSLARADHNFTPSVAADPTLQTKYRECQKQIAALFRDPNLPAAYLAAGAREKQNEVRAAIAHNPSTPVWVLKRLVADEDADVRRAAVANPAWSLSQLAPFIDQRLPGHTDMFIARIKKEMHDGFNKAQKSKEVEGVLLYFAASYIQFTLEADRQGTSYQRRMDPINLWKSTGHGEPPVIYQLAEALPKQHTKVLKQVAFKDPVLRRYLA